MDLQTFTRLFEMFFNIIHALITIGYLLIVILVWLMYRRLQDIEAHLREIRKQREN